MTRKKNDDEYFDTPPDLVISGNGLGNILKRTLEELKQTCEQEDSIVILESNPDNQGRKLLVFAVVGTEDEVNVMKGAFDVTMEVFSDPDFKPGDLDPDDNE